MRWRCQRGSIRLRVSLVHLWRMDINIRWAINERSADQHALLLTLGDVLNKKSRKAERDGEDDVDIGQGGVRNQVRCYAQDPALYHERQDSARWP